MYFLYMIRYTDILWPVHDPFDPPYDTPCDLHPHDPPAQNLGDRDPVQTPPGLTPMHYEYSEARLQEFEVRLTQLITAKVD